MEGLCRYAAFCTIVCLLTPPVWAATLKCAADSEKVGDVCIDTYEASVWSIPSTNTALIKKVQAGKATLANLTAGGATQISPSTSCSPAFPSSFPLNGNWTSPLYAVSVTGVPPSACISWFQANQACRLSGKRLLRNDEWQAAAAGTPDPGTDNGSTDCNINSLSAVNTGSRASCKSSWGVSDMVGNVSEWVADWVDQANACTLWPAAFGNDVSCVGGPGSGFSDVPGALNRGGDFTLGANAGVFAVSAFSAPSFALGNIGFRCAR